MTDSQKNNRRKFLKTAGAGLAGATVLGAPAVHAQSKTTIKWRMQSYAGPPFDLVWRALYHYHANRLHDTAVWLQPVFNASHGTSRDKSNGYLCLHISFCNCHDRRVNTGNGVSANRIMATRDYIRPLARGH